MLSRKLALAVAVAVAVALGPKVGGNGPAEPAAGTQTADRIYTSAGEPKRQRLKVWHARIKLYWVLMFFHTPLPASLAHPPRLQNFHKFSNELVDTQTHTHTHSRTQPAPCMCNKNTLKCLYRTHKHAAYCLLPGAKSRDTRLLASICVWV